MLHPTFMVILIVLNTLIVANQLWQASTADSEGKSFSAAISLVFCVFNIGAIGFLLVEATR